MASWVNGVGFQLTRGLYLAGINGIEFLFIGLNGQAGFWSLGLRHLRGFSSLGVLVGLALCVMVGGAYRTPPPQAHGTPHSAHRTKGRSY